MIKLICIVKRHPNLSHEAFSTYWCEQHATLIRRHAAVLGIQHYRQNYRSAAANAQSELQALRQLPKFEFDGIAELWYEDMTAHLTARETPAGAEALAEIIADEQQFIDLSQSVMWYSTEHCLF